MTRSIISAGQRRASAAGAVAVMASVLGFGAPHAVASTVQLNGQEIAINGENNDDAITVSSDGLRLIVTDTGTGGATTGDPLCTQVNPTTVTCPIAPPGEQQVLEFEVGLNNGVDTFVNQNFVTRDGHVHAEGTTGQKTVVGGPGSQLLAGGTDGDNLDGGAGDDRIFDGSEQGGTGGNDVLVGGPGTDETSYFRQPAVPVSISLDGIANDGVAGEADNVQVENVSTGDGNDVLIGDGEGNLLAAGIGDDLILGRGGTDALFGDGFAGVMAVRGQSLVGGNDTLDGGAGPDELDCGPGIDAALREPNDDVRVNCERTGAEVVGDNAAVGGKKKKSFKVQLRCPESEGKACSGKLKATVGAKKIGKGKFSVSAGKIERAKVKLSKKGTKALKRAGGSLLTTVEAKTQEPGGVATDQDTVFIYR